MHLSDKALLVHLAVSQWVAKKLDRKASEEVARLNGATSSAGNYNKSLLPTCSLLDAVKQETAIIRKEFYRNTLPWGIEGTFILPSANYLGFMSDFRKRKAHWERLVAQFLGSYDRAQRDAQRLLGSLYNANDYPTKAELANKFSMEMTIMPVPTAGDFRVELIDEEFATIQSDIEKRVAESSNAAIRDVWQRLYDKAAWLHGRLADPKNTFHDATFKDAQETCDLLARLNFTDDPNLEQMRREMRASLDRYHPDALRHDPAARQSTADATRRIMEKMDVFMGGLK